LLCSLLHSPVTSSLLGRNILLSTLFSTTLSHHSSLSVTDQFSQASKSTVYFQLPGKNVHDITRCVYNFLRYFKIVMYLSRSLSLGTPKGVLWNPMVSRNPVSETLPCSVGTDQIRGCVTGESKFCPDRSRGLCLPNRVGTCSGVQWYRGAHPW
jgi:hypothetical protein